MCRYKGYLIFGGFVLTNKAWMYHVNWDGRNGIPSRASDPASLLIYKSISHLAQSVVLWNLGTVTRLIFNPLRCQSTSVGVMELTCSVALTTRPHLTMHAGIPSHTTVDLPSFELGSGDINTFLKHIWHILHNLSIHSLTNALFPPIKSIWSFFLLHMIETGLCLLTEKHCMKPEICSGKGITR